MPKNKRSPESLALLLKIPEEKLNGPSSPEVARQWLQRVALHLLRLPNSGNSFQFVGSALLQYLKSEDGGEARLCNALGLTQSLHTVKRGRPKSSIKTTVSIIEMLHAGQSPATISKALDVPKSRVTLVGTKINKLLGLRQHGARPDGFSLEDARKYAASLPVKELIAMLSATISAKDILPE
jgi:hypothetical protein